MGTELMPTSSEIFSCICDEPEGKVLRTVRLIEFTPENLNKLWNQVSKFPSFMGQEIHTVTDMLRFFVNEQSDGTMTPRGLCLVVDEFIGLFWLTDIKGQEASVHYTFFDKRHRGRVDLCRLALNYTFEYFNFRRIWTQVPLYAPGVLCFVESLGFKKVGRLRKNTSFRNKFYDTNVYDLLREEFLNGNKLNGELCTTDSSIPTTSESTEV